VALKPEFKAGGTLLKNKKKMVEQNKSESENCNKGCCPTPQPCDKEQNAQAKAEASPWENLDEDKPAQMLNED
jgi:hypothetical protein